MNQTCKVCGEPAAGFHFGAFTCEGCKSFFGRSYNNINSINDCKNNNKCVINKKNRTACKACRLRKCMLVGMSKSGSRYGRRSNWFKIHCLLQEQHQKKLKESGEDSAAQTQLHPHMAPPPVDTTISMRLLAAGQFPPPLLQLPRTREELLALGLEEPFRPTTSPSVSSPDSSHNSDSSIEVSDARRIPLPIPSLLPPTFLPHPGFLFPPTFYPGLLQQNPLYNNNNNIIVNNNNSDKIFRTVANREVKRDYLDAVLQLQRNSSPMEQDNDEDEEVDVKTIPTSDSTTVQETPIDLSMRTMSEQGSSPARSEQSQESMITERGHGSEVDDDSDCDSEHRGMNRLSLPRPTPLDLTTRVLPMFQFTTGFGNN